jgi:hypothetical protein
VKTTSLKYVKFLQSHKPKNEKYFKYLLTRFVTRRRKDLPEEPLSSMATMSRTQLGPEVNVKILKNGNIYFIIVLFHDIVSQN